MFTIYFALTWGFVLPMLALACLAMDVFTGTALWHSPQVHTMKGFTMFAPDHFDVFGTDSHAEDGSTADYVDALLLASDEDVTVLTDAELDSLGDDVDTWHDDVDQLDSEVAYAGLMFDVPSDGGPWADAWDDVAPF